MSIDAYTLWDKAVNEAAANDIQLPLSPRSVGAWQRVPGAGKGPRNDAAAYKVEAECIHVIDHASGWSCTVFSDSSTSGINRAEARRRYLAAETERNAKQAEDRAKSLKRLHWQWQNAAPCRSTRYTVRKRIQTYGARYVIRDQYLLVLLEDIDGNVQSAQRLYDNGDKKAWPCLPVAGAFHLLGEVMVSQRLLICEGFATGATLHQETGLTTVCAMFANNLKAVALQIRKRYPAIKLVVCGDDDRNTPGNPGRCYAQEAAAAVGASVTFPEFPPDVSGTDFNDMYLSQQAVSA